MNNWREHAERNPEPEEDIWKVTETETNWIKRWLRYDQYGRAIGCVLIVKNGTSELIEALKQAWQETEGKYTK